MKKYLCKINVKTLSLQDEEIVPLKMPRCTITHLEVCCALLPQSTSIIALDRMIHFGNNTFYLSLVMCPKTLSQLLAEVEGED